MNFYDRAPPPPPWPAAGVDIVFALLGSLDQASMGPPGNTTPITVNPAYAHELRTQRWGRGDDGIEISRICGDWEGIWIGVRVGHPHGGEGTRIPPSSRAPDCSLLCFVLPPALALVFSFWAIL